MLDAGGDEVGRVDEAMGESDIFSGLVISTSVLGSPRWVPADDVEEITDSSVRLRLGADQVEQLDEYEARAPG